MEENFNSDWESPLMWACLALVMDPRYRLVNCMVLLDDIFSNLNKIERINEFNNKVKETLYTLFENMLDFMVLKVLLVLVHLVL